MRQRLVWFLLLLLLLAASGLTPSAVASPTEPPGATLSWSTVAKLSRAQLPSVSCAPATTTCWGIGGGELLSSADRGATWTVRSGELPVQVDELDTLTCPGADVCFVRVRLEDLSAAVAAVRPGGTTLAAVPGGGPLASVTCASTTRCLTTDGSTAAATVDGGATWQTRPAPPAGVFEVDCTTGTTTCTGVGSASGAAVVVRSDNLGRTWRALPAPAAVESLFAVDCVTALVCHAVGRYAFAPVVATTTDGGTTWHRQSLDSSGDLRSVSCPSAQVCWGFGADYSTPLAFRTTDGGTTWTRQSLGGSGGLDTEGSCPTTTTCAAMSRNGGGFTTDNAGEAWQPAAVPAALGAVRSMACPTRLSCVGLSSDSLLRPVALTTTNGGVTWARHPMPNGTGFVSSIDCPTATTCHAWAYVRTVAPSGATRFVGQSLATTDGGQTWRLHTGADVRDLGVGSIGCLDASTCLAVGAGPRPLQPQVRATADGGSTWQTLARPDGATVLNAVTCGPGYCVVVGRVDTSGSSVQTAWRTTDGGATYVARTLPNATDGYRGLDCTNQLCLAAGNDADLHGRVARSSDAGLTWREMPVPSTAFSLHEVRCGRVAVCAVAASDGTQGGSGAQLIGTSDGGRSWNVLDLPPSTSSWPLAVACPPAGLRCLTSDYGPTGFPRIVGGKVA